jgi:glutamine amidotransferase
MCIIVFKPVGAAVPDTDTLTNCWNANTHGGGVMWVADGKVHVSKGHMTLPDMLAAIAAIPWNSPAVYHFRIGTHGANTPENTHPWVVIPDVLAMVHNGILSAFGTKDYSDSRDLAETLTPFGKHFPWHASGIKILNAICGYNSKLVFLRNDGRHGIINEKAGAWHGGCWYSNNGYKRYEPMLPAHQESIFTYPTVRRGGKTSSTRATYDRGYDKVVGIAYDKNLDRIKLQFKHGTVSMLYADFITDDDMNCFIYDKSLLAYVPGSKPKLTVLDAMLESFAQQRKDRKHATSLI